MTLHRAIVDFLMTLNGMESPNGRQSILTYLGYGYLGNQLDFQGATFAFANQLTTVLEGRGNAELRQFLVDLQTAPQVSLDGRATLESLVARLDAAGAAAATGGDNDHGQGEAWQRITRLNGKQYGAFQKALLAAFDEETLSQMVTFELEENLAAIAGGSNLNSVVFDLIAWAQRSGRLPDLIQGALNAQPGNPELQAFVASLGE